MISIYQAECNNHRGFVLGTVYGDCTGTVRGLYGDCTGTVSSLGTEHIASPVPLRTECGEHVGISGGLRFAIMGAPLP